MARRSLILLLDIDNTLYEYEGTGFGKEMHNLIFTYAKTKIGLSHEDAEAISVKYYENYGLFLRGYVEHYNVDPKDYGEFVHQCSYGRLKYNEPLVRMLTRLHYGTDNNINNSNHNNDGDNMTDDGKNLLAGHVHGHNSSIQHHLYYFTNAPRAHARRVLTPLGLRPLLTRPRQAASAVVEGSDDAVTATTATATATTAAHRGDDAEGFEETVEWLGFSYQDQWRLTGAAWANKPMTAAYEAIYKAIGEEISLDEMALAAAAAADNGGDASFPTNANNTTAAAAVGSQTRGYTAHKRACLRPGSIVMVDDSLMNLDAPLELGWCAVWYAHGGLQLPADGGKAALYQSALAEGRLKIIRDIMELEGAVDELAQMPEYRYAYEKGMQVNSMHE